MKLVTYKGSGVPGETVFITAGRTRLVKDAPTVVADNDVPEAEGHSFDVADAPEKAKAGDVIRKKKGKANG